MAKKVYQYWLDGKLIKIWGSIVDITREKWLDWNKIWSRKSGVKKDQIYAGFKWTAEPINQEK